MDREQGNGEEDLITEEKKQKVRDIQNPVDKKAYFMSLLTKEAEKRNLQPIIVGGTAVDIYTEGIFQSKDIDLVGNRKLIGEILESSFGFRPHGRHWINEDLGIFIEIPDSHLAGDKERLTTIRIGHSHVYVIGIEDLIIDRLNGCVSWKSETDCKQAEYLIRLYREKIDFVYLKDKARAEGILKKLRVLIGPD